MEDFYTKEEKDLVIQEINVDTLEFVEIVSSIDGELITLKEGAYVVTIYSEDRAKGKELNFVVDKTAPSIVVAGIEDGGQYTQVSSKIKKHTEVPSYRQSQEKKCFGISGNSHLFRGFLGLKKGQNMSFVI